jgi:hypothetical protein
MTPKAEANEANREQTCGEELAASAEVPRQWGALMTHVATNLELHAAWVGGESTAAKRERDALIVVASAYRAMASAAAQAASVMETMKELPAAPHDPARIDRAAQARRMREKIDMQRTFAALLLRHADVSEAALAEMAS